jgi:hypothetical protein
MHLLGQLPDIHQIYLNNYSTMTEFISDYAACRDLLLHASNSRQMRISSNSMSADSILSYAPTCGVRNLP